MSPPSLQAREDSNLQPPVLETGALPIELRTSNPSPAPLLGREPWPGAESNCRHRDFQSRALPTELPGPTKKTARPLLGAGGLVGVGRPYRLPAPARRNGLHVSATVQERTRRAAATRPCPVRELALLVMGSPASEASFTWETPPAAAFRANSGGGIRTRDLRVMSPTSYQTAPPRNRAQVYPGLRESVNPESGFRGPFRGPFVSHLFAGETAGAPRLERNSKKRLCFRRTTGRGAVR